MPERALALLLVLAAFVPGARMHAQDEVKSPTNLRTFQTLAEQAGAEVGAALGQGDTSSVAVSVVPKETIWFLADGISRGVALQGHHLASSSAARYAIECGALEVRIVYANLRREGIFAGKKMDRTVTVALHVRTVDQAAGGIVLSREFRKESSDVVYLSEIDEVENPAIPLTHGKIPVEGLFSTLAEPLIVVGAIAMALFLLFSVRS